MSTDLDALVAKLATVLDDDLVGEAHRSGSALLESIVALPTPRTALDGMKTRRRRVRLLAVAAALALGAVLSLPAFGVGDDIVSLFAGMHDPGAPVPTASDVLIASGEDGVSWKIVATTSDQGLCLGLYYRVGDDRFGPGGCGYTDIRGDLPPGIRGDPSSKCIATPTTLVPCGSLPLHWIGPVGDEAPTVGPEGRFAYGPSATDVASVDLVLEDGQTVHASVVDQPDGLPLNFYWATWSGSALRTAVARDAGGRVLERRVPPWNGNPTGDPDGPSSPDPA